MLSVIYVMSKRRVEFLAVAANVAIHVCFAVTAVNLPPKKCILLVQVCDGIRLRRWRILEELQVRRMLITILELGIS